MVVSRFAPAPTGYLHLGHVVNAIEVWRAARERGGRVLLRIEDHDRSRCRPEYEAAIREDLAWIGFAPDAEVPRQSARGDRYAEVLAGLEARGLAYPCSCSRRDIAAVAGDEFNEEARYPGTCRDRHVDPASTSARRVRMEPGAETFTDLRLGPQSQSPADQCGDFLIRDRNGNWTYQFCVAVDDCDQGVTLVVRGEDLLGSTGRQIRLARMIGRQSPPVFLHHALIRKPGGAKLSKSDGDSGVRELRAAGMLAAEVVARARALGQVAMDD
ncbi:MAG: glutamate--tRNA ligase family protein [Gemmatimonadota bacterium]|nr:glutamate--tRNA ligase family protein [Gemmatimonadota bacterium]